MSNCLQIDGFELKLELHRQKSGKQSMLEMRGSHTELSCVPLHFPHLWKSRLRLSLFSPGVPRWEASSGSTRKHSATERDKAIDMTAFPEDSGQDQLLISIPFRIKTVRTQYRCPCPVSTVFKM